VLDEVDAPLDDANVDRYCNMLDEMRRRTQTRFIAITHNPVTMSRMDRLFGVTMPERGVSQLVAGFIVDRVLHTTPWGLIGGVLIGFALSIWMARRTANRLMALARQDSEPLPSVPFDDDDEEL
jgi:hypothetical protein